MRHGGRRHLVSIESEMLLIRDPLRVATDLGSPIGDGLLPQPALKLRFQLTGDTSCWLYRSSYHSVPHDIRRQQNHLLETGMKRGYLTYEELNDALPDDLVASKDIDDLMMMFVELDIMVIDEANREEIEKVRRIREIIARK